MKRKPDMMATLVIIFCVGLVVSGFTTFSYTRERPIPATSLLISVSADTSDSGFRQQ